MSVTPRGNRWQAYVKIKGQRYRKDFATRGAAEAWEAEVRAAALNGRALPAGKEKRPVTIGELADEVYGLRWEGKDGGKTALTNYRDWVGIMGRDTPVKDISRADVTKVLKAFKDRGLEGATQNRKRATYRVIMQEAVERELISRIPLWEKLPESGARERIISAEEEDAMLRLFHAHGDIDMHDYVVISIDTGLRQSEVLQLRPQNASPTHVSVLRREAKSKKTRHLPLTARAAAVVARRLASCNGGKLFPSLTVSRLEDAWKAAATAIGIDLEDDDEFVPHAMRHTFCTRMGQLTDIETVRQLAGHASITTTQRYVKTNEKRMEEAIRLLDGGGPQATSVAQSRATRRNIRIL
jgi:integrase